MEKNEIKNDWFTSNFGEVKEMENNLIEERQDFLRENNLTLKLTPVAPLRLNEPLVNKQVLLNDISNIHLWAQDFFIQPQLRPKQAFYCTVPDNGGMNNNNSKASDHWNNQYYTAPFYDLAAGKLVTTSNILEASNVTRSVYSNAYFVFQTGVMSLDTDLSFVLNFLASYKVEYKSLRNLSGKNGLQMENLFRIMIHEVPANVLNPTSRIIFDKTEHLYEIDSRVTPVTQSSFSVSQTLPAKLLEAKVLGKKDHYYTLKLMVYSYTFLGEGKGAQQCEIQMIPFV